MDTGGGSRMSPAASAARSSSRLYQLRFGDFLVVHPQAEIAAGHRAEAEHQALRHRPGLAAHVADAADRDPGFLADFAGHRLLGRFPRLDEAGQDGDPARRPAPVAGQQAPVVLVGDQHDHRRVDPREMLAPVHRAALRVAGGERLGQRAAAGAVRVRDVPVGQGHRVGEQAGVPVTEQRGGLAQPGLPLPRPGLGQPGRLLLGRLLLGAGRPRPGRMAPGCRRAAPARRSR